MNLGDIAEKVANQQKLTPQELDFWKNSLTSTQTNNNFIAGIRNGQGNINANSILAKAVTVGQETIYGLSTKRKKTNALSTNGVFEGLFPGVSDTIVYNDGYGAPATVTTITIPITGVYLCRFNAVYDVAAGVGKIQTYVVLNGAPTTSPQSGMPIDKVVADTSTINYLHSSDTFSANKGDTVRLNSRQDTGGDLTISYADIELKQIR